MRISDWSSDLCSSDLALSLLCAIGARALLRHRVSWAIGLLFMATAATAGALWLDFAGWRAAGLAPQESGQRSEEHTSELQSLMRISYAVFCLKKKTKK